MESEGENQFRVPPLHPLQTEGPAKPLTASGRGTWRGGERRTGGGLLFQENRTAKDIWWCFKVRRRRRERRSICFSLPPPGGAFTNLFLRRLFSFPFAFAVGPLLSSSCAHRKLPRNCATRVGGSGHPGVPPNCHTRGGGRGQVEGGEKRGPISSGRSSSSVPSSSSSQPLLQRRLRLPLQSR